MCRPNKAKPSIMGIGVSMDVNREHSLVCAPVFLLHKSICPCAVPSFNKDVTYLLTYLLPYMV